MTLVNMNFRQYMHISDVIDHANHLCIWGLSLFSFWLLSIFIGWVIQIVIFIMVS